MKVIYIYSTLENWIDDRPDTTLNGKVKNINNNIIEIMDEKGFTQIINIEKLFAVVY